MNRPVRDQVSQLLFTLHEQAMDASNDPTRESIENVKKMMRTIQRALPLFYQEEYERQRELMKKKAV